MKPKNQTQAMQIIRFFIFLVGLFEIVRAGQNENNVFGSCLGVDFPHAVAKNESWGDVALQVFDADKLLDTLGPYYSNHSEYAFFNREYIRDRMGGDVSACNFTLDSFMSIGKDPFQARIINAGLSAIPELDIVIFPKQGDFNEQEEAFYSRTERRMIVRVNALNLSEKVRASLLRTQITHESIHMLFDAADRHFDNAAARRHKTAFEKGIEEVKRAGSLLKKYRDGITLKKAEKQYIEDLIRVAQECVEEVGDPIWSFTSSTKNTFIVKDESGHIRLKETVDEIPIYHPVSFFEEHFIENQQSHFFISCEDPLATYLWTLRLISYVFKQEKRYQKEDQGAHEEFFTFAFSEVPSKIALRFFKPLHDELLLSVVKLENKMTRQPMAREAVEHPLRFYPGYVRNIFVGTFQDKLGQSRVTAENVDQFVRKCKMVLTAQERKKYFVVEATLRDIIQRGLLQGEAKANAQLLLAKTLYRQAVYQKKQDIMKNFFYDEQDKETEVNAKFYEEKGEVNRKFSQAYTFYHRAAKNNMVFDEESLRHYEMLSHAAGPWHQKSGAENIIGRQKHRAEL